MKILSNLIKSAVLLVLVLLFASCYKEDEFMVSNPLLVSAHEGVTLNKWIPEKNAILGTQKDATGAVNKIEYDMTTKTIKPSNYYSDFGDYTFIAPNTYYTAEVRPSNKLVVDVIDIFSGAISQTFNFPYNVTAAAVSGDKLFTVEYQSSVNPLHAINLSTNTELFSTYVYGSVANIIVSKNRERIYTATDAFNNLATSHFLKSNNFIYIKTEPFNADTIFKPDSYSMTDNGKYFVTMDGNLYNDSFVNLKNFSTSLDPVIGAFITPDGKKVLVYNNIGYRVYTLPAFELVSSEDLVLGKSGRFGFIKAVPFTYNGQMFISTTYKDPFLEEKTYITLIEN
jgi:hypothetical protein